MPPPIDFVKDEKTDKNNMSINPPNIKPMSIQSKIAFAQLALLGFSPALNAQTNIMIIPIKGMLAISKVHIHSPVFITDGGEVLIFSFSI